MSTSIYLMILFIFLSSCGLYTEMPTQKFTSLLKGKSNKSLSHLNFDGMYQQINVENYHRDYYENGKKYQVDTPYVDRPLFFFESGLIVFSQVLYPLKESFDKVMLTYGTQKESFYNQWGVFDMVGDTIRAYIYIDFAAKGRLLCNFEGIVKNRDTILQWHMIQPYPKKVPLVSHWVIEKLSKPKNLYFKAVHFKNLIDPEKAWINEFRNETIRTKRKKK